MLVTTHKWDCGLVAHIDQFESAVGLVGREHGEFAAIREYQTSIRDQASPANKATIN